MFGKLFGFGSREDAQARACSVVLGWFFEEWCASGDGLSRPELDERAGRYDGPLDVDRAIAALLGSGFVVLVESGKWRPVSDLDERVIFGGLQALGERAASGRSS